MCWNACALVHRRMIFSVNTFGCIDTHERTSPVATTQKNIGLIVWTQRWANKNWRMLSSKENDWCRWLNKWVLPNKWNSHFPLFQWAFIRWFLIAICYVGYYNQDGHYQSFLPRCSMYGIFTIPILPQKWPTFVGKSSNTMVRIWVRGNPCQSTQR